MENINRITMSIEELPDRQARWQEYNLVRNEPLLEYVWEVALEFAAAPSTFMDETETFAPNTFANRYAESKLTDEERYARHKEVYQTEQSFEEYTKNRYYKLDTSFKDRFLTNKDLQNTIEAFGLDVSKFWYLLLFVYDYIEDFATNAPTPEEDTLNEFNKFNLRLEEATEVILKKNGRKSYDTDREDIMKLIKTALDYFVNSYNDIVTSDSTREEQFEQLEKLGLNDYINMWTIPVDCKQERTLDISYKKWYFAKMFLFFLKNRKAKTLPHIKEKVSKDKMMFISRLIYTVGYHGKEYNKEYDDNDNKNRMLSNLLRKYAKEKFPTMVHKYYWS